MGTSRDRNSGKANDQGLVEAKSLAGSGEGRPGEEGLQERWWRRESYFRGRSEVAQGMRRRRPAGTAAIERGTVVAGGKEAIVGKGAAGRKWKRTAAEAEAAGGGWRERRWRKESYFRGRPEVAQGMRRRRPAGMSSPVEASMP